jgi:hypothetical protein
LDPPGSVESDSVETSWDSPLHLLDSFVRRHAQNFDSAKIQRLANAELRKRRLADGNKATEESGDEISDQAKTKSPLAGGGIAAAAAQAAAARSQKSMELADTTGALAKPKSPFAGGGIAAAAAQAAAARRQKNEESADETDKLTKAKSPFAGGGIAAAAAKAAAARRQKGEVSADETDELAKPMSPFAGGGIAAAAAQAAADESEELAKAKSPFAGGGIAAAAAQAAAARMQKGEEPADKTEELTKPKSPFAGGGIAAAAAKAAAARLQKSEDTETEELPKPKSPFAGGGIAAAAAKAAAARRQKGEVAADETDELARPMSPFAREGIAVAAAHAAALRRQKNEESADETEELAKPKSPFAGGGIAAAAAQAAAARMQTGEEPADKIEELTKPKSPFAGGGIAAAAAQAAAARLQKSEDTETEKLAKPKSPFSGGGIAAAAAQAAAARRQKGEVSADETEELAKPMSPFAGGGIASATAQAAAARRQKNEKSADETEELAKPKSPFAGGGIAAAAAQAAALRRQKNEESADETEDLAKPKSPVAGGGIAAAAAQAAAARRQKSEELSDDTEELAKAKSPFAGGGKSVAAAQAAAPRRQKTEESSDETEELANPKSPFVGGLVAAAAAQSRPARWQISAGASNGIHRGLSLPSLDDNDCVDVNEPASTLAAPARWQNDEDVTDRSRRALSLPRLDEDDCIDSNEAGAPPVAPAFFIPGITGKARCLKARVGDFDSVAIVRPGVAASVTESSSASERSGSPENPEARQIRSKRSSSLQRSPAGSGRRSRSPSIGASSTRPRTNSSSTQGSRIPKRNVVSSSILPHRDTLGSRANERSPLPTTRSNSSDSTEIPTGGPTQRRSHEKLTSLSRYSPSTYQTNPFLRGGYRSGRTERSPDLEENDTLSKSVSTTSSIDQDGEPNGSVLRSDLFDMKEWEEPLRDPDGEPREGNLDLHRADTSESFTSGTATPDSQLDRGKPAVDGDERKSRGVFENNEKPTSPKKDRDIDQDGEPNGNVLRNDLFDMIEWEEPLRDPDGEPGEGNRDLDPADSSDSFASGTATPDSQMDRRNPAVDGDERISRDVVESNATSPSSKKDRDKEKKARKEKKAKKGGKKDKKKSKASAYEALVDDQDYLARIDDGTRIIAPIQEEVPGNWDSFKVDDCEPGYQAFGEGSFVNALDRTSASAPAVESRPAGHLLETIDKNDNAETNTGATATEVVEDLNMGNPLKDLKKNRHPGVSQTSSSFDDIAVAATSSFWKKLQDDQGTGTPIVVDDEHASGRDKGGAVAILKSSESEDVKVHENADGGTPIPTGDIVNSSHLDHIQTNPFLVGGIRTRADAERWSGRGEEVSIEVMEFGGGIAAGAMQGDAARLQMSESFKDVVSPIYPFAGGGIAAAAAQAAAVRSMRSSEAVAASSIGSPKSPFAKGGIGADAVQATALARGDIASAAAQAAAARREESTDKAEELAKPKSPFAGGGIAAAAAQAAAARRQKSEESTDISEELARPKSPFAGGGIAAAAAKAAAAQRQKSEESADMAEELVKPKSPFAGGGIAASAAQAAAARRQKSEESADMAEELAKAKSPFAGGGIAAAAAKAAAARRQKSEESADMAEELAKPKSPFAGGGIAAAAAKAAAARLQKSEDTETEELTKPKSPFAGGGIAAAAAKAAAARRQKGEVSADETDELAKPMSPFAGEGIAAAATKAAAARRQKSEESEDESEELAKPKSPFAGGGIAAAAAQAAAARMQKGEKPADKNEELTKPKSPFAGGGIAAAAAQAAVARSMKSNGTVAGGGMAVVGAKAAVPDAIDGLQYRSAGRDIAASATEAAAARQGSFESLEDRNLAMSQFAEGESAGVQRSKLRDSGCDNEIALKSNASGSAKGVGSALGSVFAVDGIRNAHPRSEGVEESSVDKTAAPLPNDILLAVLTVALQGMTVDSRDLASLQCVRVICEYLSHWIARCRLDAPMPFSERLGDAIKHGSSSELIGTNPELTTSIDQAHFTIGAPKSPIAGGGIAAAAAQAAAARQHSLESVKDDVPAISPFAGGGIAAAAAQAAAERSKKSKEIAAANANGTQKSPFAGGGIAAAAAQAAAARQHALESVKDDVPAISPFAGGGIAAAAAQAAAARSKKSKETVAANATGTQKSPFAGGGIAAAAAQAAATRQHALETMEDDVPAISLFAGGGIAAAAAQAAAERSKKSKEKVAANANGTQKSPFAGGGIAAAAAQAAAARQHALETMEDDVPAISPFAGGGIAAAAAQAAAARQHALETMKDDVPTISPFAGGGIAAAAAQAAAERSKKSKEKVAANANGTQKSPFAGGGIAAAAAQAAAARQHALESVKDDVPAMSPFAGGGIAAAAAQAAAERSKKSKEKVAANAIGTQKSPFAGGGIAAAAAQAAAARQHALESVKDDVPAMSPFAGGGIAAAAAQAAAERNSETVAFNATGAPKSPFAGVGIPADAAQATAARQHALESVKDDVPSMSPFAGGGIAAAAAQAAAASSKRNSETLATKSPFAGGGIAAAAAQAAAARRHALETMKDDVPAISPFAGGGIAAAAAQAAAERSKKSKEKVASNANVTQKSPFAGGGIAAAAAQAAAARQHALESVKDDVPAISPFAGGGIAAAAAQAAAARSMKSSESLVAGATDALKAPFAGGGIAAAAAQAAAARQHALETVKDDVPAMSSFAGGGIAAAAVQAAALRSLTNSKTVAADASVAPKSPFAGGVIAAAAAQTAAARQQTLASVKDDVPAISLFAGGGIASAAAQAAAVRNKRNKEAAAAGATCARSTGNEERHAKFSFAEGDPTSAAAPIPGLISEVAQETRQGLQSARLGEKETVDSALTSVVNGGTLTRLQEMALLRSLSLSNQAMSVGMAGWLEYGSSELLDRSVDRAFEVMQNLASLHAQHGRWTVTVDILRALVMKCEEHLPLYHPLTLVSMLDLVGALTELSEHVKAQKISMRIMQRLAVYLSEQEEYFFDARHAWLHSPKQERVIFQEHSGTDFVIMITEFVKALTKLETRDVLRLFRQDNGARMLNHSIIADSLGVLANCTALNETTGVEHTTLNKSSLMWSRACHHYRQAFEGWSKVGQRLHHPNISAIVCGLARCLRETGERTKAIKILEAVVTARKSESLKKAREVGGSGLPYSPSDTVTFLPPKTHGSTVSMGTWSTIDDEQINALCLWSLAIYRVEENPTERERIYALNLLHLSAESLRRALKDKDLSDNAAPLEMLRCVEAEARELFQPVQDADYEIERKELLESDLLHNPVQNLTKRLEMTARRLQGRFVSA